MANVLWDQAGFTDSQSRAGKPIPSGHVMVPGSVKLEENSLVWHIGTNIDAPKTYRPSPAMLNRFLRLHDAITPNDVLDYARRYGMLLLDEDGKPAFNCGVEGREFIHDWRRVSLMACAFLNVAAALKNGRMGDPADWQVLDPFCDPTFPKHPNPDLQPYLPHGIAAARLAFRHRFQEWLHFGRITFSLEIELKRRGWRTEVDYGGRLFSALVLQLLLTVVNADSLYFCSGCGHPYARLRDKKRPKVGQRNFCDECVQFGVPLQLADRDRKQKHLQARRLFETGKSVVEIAIELDSKTASIRRWLKGIKQNGKTRKQ